MKKNKYKENEVQLLSVNSILYSAMIESIYKKAPYEVIETFAKRSSDLSRAVAMSNIIIPKKKLMKMSVIQIEDVFYGRKTIDEIKIEKCQCAGCQFKRKIKKNKKKIQSAFK